jgi:hypothetical protein
MMNLEEYKNYEKATRTTILSNWTGKIVRHFKGDKYLILNIAYHSETGEEYVVYKALYGECKVYIRPLKMFIDRCTEEQKRKFNQDYRFEFIELCSVKK